MTKAEKIALGKENSHRRKERFSTHYHSGQKQPATPLSVRADKRG